MVGLGGEEGPPPSFFLFSPATFSLINCDGGENKAF